MDGKHGNRAIESVGERLGISRSAAYQLRQHVLSRLRQSFPELEVGQ
jgi:hypothetical protein